MLGAAMTSDVAKLAADVFTRSPWYVVPFVPVCHQKYRRLCLLRDQLQSDNSNDSRRSAVGEEQTVSAVTP